ncbi:hypothetical protein [Metallibacterium scheffleri]|uniref:Uncharacterized protein n=1 Tax=Metallibacterium scheffleri TaxID=993689 RepID=A0A4S3KL31_9GAMM|nr:hypothetical protein [Metallibacterium scheffleri]THD09562.1 hypothetical protein B1806_10865 [Metallibacterium scheffleri]
MTLHACAVGERAGMASMHVSARDDSSSLLPIGSEQTRIFPGTQEAGHAAVEVIAWLRERGFGLLGAYNMAFDHAGRAVQADFLFGR